MDDAKCSFSLDFEDSAEALVARTQAAIEKAGGQFAGTVDHGTFSVSSPMGSIEGRYAVTGQVLSVAILEKPKIVSCGIIKTMLESYLDD